MRVLAKGVRKIPSRRGGHLEPLTQIAAIVNSGRDWRYVAHVETINYFEALRKDGASVFQAQHLAQVLLQVIEEGEAYPDLFDYVAWVWSALPTLPFTKQALLEVASTMLIFSAGGIMPSLEACQRCRKIGGEEAVILDADEGGWHCLACHGTLAGAGASLPPRLLKVLRFAAARPMDALRLKLSEAEAQQITSALRSYTVPASVAYPFFARPAYA